MSSGGKYKGFDPDKVKDTRASSGQILDSKGEPAWGTPRKTITQEQVMDQIAKHFKEKIDRLNLGTIEASEFQKIWIEETEWAMDIFSRYEKNNPGITVPTSKIELATQLFKRSEMLRITEFVEARGLKQICKEIVLTSENAAGGSAVKYDKFITDFISTETDIKILLKETGASDRQIRSIMAKLKGKLEIVEVGRSIGLAATFEYPEYTIRSKIRRKAQLMGKRNLTDLIGGTKFLGHFFKQNFIGKPRMTFSEYLDKEYLKGYSTKLTERWTLAKTAKGIGILVVVGGLAYMFGRCSGVIGGEEAKEGERPSVTKKKRTPVSPAEIELYKNPLFHAKDKTTRTPKFVAIAKHMTNMKLNDEEQVKVAKILNKLPGQFVGGMDLRESLELAIILRKLTPNVPIQKLADTVVSIQQYIDSSKTKDFAWTLVKSDKAKKGDVTYWIENPPYKKIMTEEWYTRPFSAFTKAGFKSDTKFLGVLSSTLRKAKVKKGKVMVPLTIAEQNELAGSLATYYFSTKKKKIPETYQKDIEIILKLRSKGFRMGNAVTILSKLDSLYKPEHLDSIFKSMLPRLAPSMKEEVLVVALEAPAVKNPELAAKRWKLSQGTLRQHLLALTERGFKKPKAEEILSKLDSIYKPEHLDSIFKSMLPKLKPGMKEDVLVVALEAPAVKNPELAAKRWKLSQGTLRQHLLALTERGFKKPKAEEILSRLDSVYKPEHLDSVFKNMLPKLKPGMEGDELGLVIEAPAFRNRSMVTKNWVSSADSRISFLLVKDAKSISKALRENPQVYYEKSMGIVLALSKLWQKEQGKFTNKEFKALYPQIASLSRSDSLAHLAPAEMAKILVTISSSVKPKQIRIGSSRKDRKRVTPRAEVLRHLENKFTGQKPTVSAVLAEMSSYIGANPDYAL